MFAFPGCAGKRTGRDFSGPDQAGKPGVSASSKLIVTPEVRLIGTVVKVNERAAFVVLNFPAGHVPGTDMRMSLFRRGAKVGEVKITERQLDDYVVADLLNGEAKVGDEARE
ncbi:MAG: hypothetical protein C5B50_20760 [Verrucomicrobia bacterium]|nr:MAG: hypothetical protein C5B50_20760 [Verrucomicrobiota bacterium]